MKARGNVEDWLGKVEEAMFSNLRKLVKGAITDYENRPRKEWVVYHSSQVVLTVSQIVWCRDVTDVLEGDFDRLEGMKEFEQKSFKVCAKSKLCLFFKNTRTAKHTKTKEHKKELLLHVERGGNCHTY